MQQTQQLPGSPAWFKIMIKYRVLYCCFVVLVFPKTALSQTFFSAGAEIAIPHSYGLNMVAGTLTGGSLRIESFFGKHTTGIATFGYLFSSEQQPYTYTPKTTSTYKVLPFQIGIKYYTKKIGEVPKGLFFSGEAGLLFTSTQFTFESNPEPKTKHSDIAFATGIGYMLGNFESHFRLQHNLSDAGFEVYYFNLRVAYAFLKHKKRS